MSSSARRGQVEPLPAMIALAAFAIALSIYGVSVESVPLGQGQSISEATVRTAVDTVSEGVVVRPTRLQRLDGRLPDGTAVTITAGGERWHWGPRHGRDAQTTMRHVLVATDDGARPGVLRVSR